MKKPKSLSLTVADVRKADGFWSDYCPVGIAARRQLEIKYLGMGLDKIFENRNEREIQPDPIASFSPSYKTEDYHFDKTFSEDIDIPDNTILRTFQLTYS